MNILITGHAGFIGFHLSKAILTSTSHKVIGIDNFNNYYDVSLKKKRSKILKEICNKNNFIEFKLDVKSGKLETVFNKFKIHIVIHLAAQAGIRYTLSNPKSYIDSNIYAFFNLMENMSKFNVKKFIFASSSSVYGSNKKLPFNEEHKTDNPIQLYAVTKKTNELMANVYSSLFSIQTIGLRFFTVYGEYGRPDMAIYKFVKSIDNNKIINVYGNGKLKRDFTYVDDVVFSILKIVKLKKWKFNNPHNKYFDIFNIGGSSPVTINKLINLIELNLNKKAKINYIKQNPIDMDVTHASCKKLNLFININNITKLNLGIKKFIEWYKNFYNSK